MSGSLLDLRPGDVFFGPIRGIVPGLLPVGAGQALLGEVFRVGGMSVRHAGIVVEASRTLPPGTVRDRVTGRYYAPGERQLSEADFVSGDFDVYETGVITAPKLVEAMPSGARLVDMRQDTHWTSRHAYVRLPEDYPGQAENAALLARAMIGTPYSFASYAALAAWRFGVRADRLARWIGRRGPQQFLNRHDTETPGWGIKYALPREAICSVLVDQAWTLAGKQVMPHGTRSQIVTPGRLAGHLLTVPGAQWFWPA